MNKRLAQAAITIGILLILYATGVGYVVLQIVFGIAMFAVVVVFLPMLTISILLSLFKNWHQVRRWLRDRLDESLDIIRS